MTDNGTEIIEAESRELVATPATLFGTDDPQEIVRKATAQADSLADVIKQKKLYSTISGRRYVLLEGWTLLGSMIGVFAIPAWTHAIDDGWEARVEARTLGGALVGAAEAECLRSEKNWSNRDDYALRSMAQTRASAKALRLPLGFIMTLAGYDATPREEMPDEPDVPSHAPALVQQAVGAGATVVPSEDVQAALDRGHEKKPITVQAVRIRAAGLSKADTTELMRILVEDYPHCKIDGKPHMNKLSQAELAAVSATVDGMLKA